MENSRPNFLKILVLVSKLRIPIAVVFGELCTLQVPNPVAKDQTNSNGYIKNLEKITITIKAPFMCFKLIARVFMTIS